ncbi:GntP family permease [Aureliella helgolandensis]|uniref:Inner membrane permease YgbN n=1 Tax=Aureliella helgolandensis TaxID=2527968 RepID=A0A518G519_9BACT|nr:SLC13 family permease [Aureliella helgolandensis]QDV23695.1 Inner membrane permease YgbN [Aureliella helgolandensis]
MSVLAVAGVGIAVVLVAILLLRLHPLIALLIGSLFLLAATPPEIKIRNQLSSVRHQVLQIATDSPLIGLAEAVATGDYHWWPQESPIPPKTRVKLQRVATPEGSLEVRTLAKEGEPEQSDAEVDHDLVWYHVESYEPLETAQQGPSARSVAPEVGVFPGVLGDSLVAVEDVQQAQDHLWTGLGSQLAEGFAKTFRKLGIPVTMAAIVGVCLLESGAAARLVGAVVWLFGVKGTNVALTFSGFVLGVPVYFDNVFYLLLPLAKAAGRVRPEIFLASVMAIIVGATMAHSLVPPTPGPLLVASALNVNVGTMMLAGLIVGGAAASVGFSYGMVCHRWVKLRPEQLPTSDAPRKSAPAGTRKMPLWLAAIPVAIPIALLGGSEIVQYWTEGTDSSGWQQLSLWLSLFKDPNLIFIGTAVFSIAMLRYYSSKEVVGSSVTRGLSDAGTIVLLTCAGGAFGAALQQLQLATAIGQRFEGLTAPWGMLATAFFLTTIIRAAQGSATVAMITSASIVAPVAASVPLPFHPVYVALAIGCGSKPLPWMNDSGFWQVATMTGMTPGQTLKSFSVALTLMGLTGFAVTLLGAWLFPMI